MQEQLRAEVHGLMGEATAAAAAREQRGAGLRAMLEALDGDQPELPDHGMTGVGLGSPAAQLTAAERERRRRARKATKRARRAGR